MFTLQEAREYVTLKVLEHEFNADSKRLTQELNLDLKKRLMGSTVYKY